MSALGSLRWHGNCFISYTLAKIIDSEAVGLGTDGNRLSGDVSAGLG